MKILKPIVRLLSASELNDPEADISENPEYRDAVHYLRSIKLTEFEICNILDFKPKKLVFLQLIIEEMTDRLQKEQMEHILELIGGIPK